MARRIRFKIQKTSWAVLALSAASVLLQNQAPLPVLFLLTGLPVLMLFSFFLSVIALIRVRHSVQAPLPPSPPSAPETSVEVFLKRPRFLPGVRLSAVWDLRFGPGQWLISASVASDGRGRALWAPPGRGLWRGRFEATVSDFFGFFSLSISMGSDVILEIPPQKRDINILRYGPRTSEKHAAFRLSEHAEEKMERRPYVPGDDPRRLDWRHYARTGFLLTRIGQDTRPAGAHISLLVSAPVPPRQKAGRRKWKRLETHLGTAASLAERITAEGGSFQALLPGETSWKQVHPSWDHRLAAAHPSAETQPLPPAGETLWILGPEPDIERLANAAKEAGCHVVIGLPKPPPRQAVPFFTAGLNDAIAANVRNLIQNRRNTRIIRDMAGKGFEIYEI